MIFLNACSYENQFVWQQEVLITNFRKFNISKDMHVVVWYCGNADLSKWKQLELKYSEVKFFYYIDKGTTRWLYIPQLRPHILKEHFKIYEKEFKDEIFFYHDADIIFNYLPDFETLMKDDICWQSNVNSYLDYDYLFRKQQQANIPNNEALEKMAEIGGITIDTIKEYDNNTGGAQYILKNIDYTFWEDVERMCLEIRKNFFYNSPNSINSKYFNSEDEGFQSWCADMWAVNFALWKRGIKTSITPLLDFSMVYDKYEVYLKKPIYHDAGANHNDTDVFIKGRYRLKSPIGENITVSKNKASYAYVEAIKQVK